MIDQIKTLLTTPLTEKLDMVHLFLLVGIVIVFIALWLLVLNHAKAAVAEVI